jgi:hypothetical protein
MGKVFKAMQRKQYLEVDVRTVDSSVEIMDEFDRVNDGHYFYESLLLKNALFTRIFDQKYSISFYIAKSRTEDYPVLEQGTPASTTFSELRQLTKVLQEMSGTDPTQVPPKSVYYPVLRTIRYHSRQGTVEINRKLPMKAPLIFRAQNSYNLTGYGDEWFWGYRIKEGTRYGETNNYYVTHIEVRPR